MYRVRDLVWSFISNKIGAFAVSVMLLSPIGASANDQFEPEAIASGASSAKPWSVMVFGGKLSRGNLDDVLRLTTDHDFTDTSFAGAAVSREVWRNDWISVEMEAGAGQQFGGRSGNRATQVWGAGYLRYHHFPWNNVLRTSIAASIGVNYSSRKTDFENGETNGGKTKKLQHYFSPEIAFSLPDYPQTELVFRVHHRSSVWGLFGCDGCGSNVPTIGLRYRF